MMNLNTYDFGYTWIVSSPLVIPLAVAIAVGGLALWRGWSRWISAVAGVVIAWSAVGLGLSHLVWGINSPMQLPTPNFLASGSGRVLDAGAGSGRAAVGVLLARPRATVTGLDIYEGFWGIEDNTPERFMRNARIAGVADRAEARVGDMRSLPFDDGTFDAVVSSYAMDHLGRDGTVEAIAEAARVLKPRGELLLMLVNVDWLTWFISPPMAHHPPADPARWRALLDRGGFVLEEEGTKPVTLYFFAKKRA
jgi:SAM-dependent methyltransferase